MTDREQSQLVVEFCGVLGRLHSDEGLAQTNNNAELNKSAKPITDAADHKCGEEKNGKTRGKARCEPKTVVAGIAEPIVPLSLFCFFLVFGSFSFFCFWFLLFSFSLLFFVSEPHAGGNDGGNTELRKVGGSGWVGHVADTRGCSDREMCCRCGSSTWLASQEIGR
jgi:hypothetical protein